MPPLRDGRVSVASTVPDENDMSAYPVIVNRASAVAWYPGVASAYRLAVTAFLYPHRNHHTPGVSPPKELGLLYTYGKVKQYAICGATPNTLFEKYPALMRCVTKSKMVVSYTSFTHAQYSPDPKLPESPFHAEYGQPMS